ncbi:neuromodulin [Caloenas nicobarica]
MDSQNLDHDLLKGPAELEGLELELLHFRLGLPRSLSVGYCRQEMRKRFDNHPELVSEKILTYVPVFSSSFFPCSSSKVEKNEDGDQKIEQDGIKPEDKAHKAATKIQASFRGHITRKKLKGEKKGDALASESDAADKKEEGPAGGAAENKESEAPAATEAAAADSAQLEEGSKDSSAPAEEKKGDGAADTGSEQPAPQAATPAASSEEKPAAAAETESATKASTDNSPSLKADEAQDKEEPKQADVPAADATATTTPAEDATAKATAQPQMETVESSQTEEKTDAVEETKPTESAQQEEVKEEESKADQENA